MKPEFAPKIAQYQRTYRDRRTFGPGQARGERIAGAVLTEELVRTIRAMRQGLGLGPKRIQEALAAEGVAVNVRTIEAVAYGRTWRHVT